jgi:glycerol-3-phosphate dehydrogenase (NAD(P)+)
MSTKVTVWGAGAFGSAVAHRLSMSSKKLNVCLFALEDFVVEGIKKDGVNPMIIPQVGDHKFLPNVSVTGNIEESVKDSTVIFYAIPGKFTQDFLGKHAHLVQARPFINCSKGMVVVDGMISTIKAIAASCGIKPAQYGCVSGPSFAKSMFTNSEQIILSVAADDEGVRMAIADMFADKSTHIRVYTSDDVIGQELCGALKNVTAVAAGLASKSGASTQPAVISVLWNDVSKVIQAMDGGHEVHMNPPMFGDLIATCSMSSRNYTFGERVANGENARDVIANMPSVEGYNSLPLLMRYCETVPALSPELARFRAVFDCCEGRVTIADMVNIVLS